MKAIAENLEIIKNIQPQKVQTYLQQKGWQQQQKIGDKALIFTLPHAENEAWEIFLPLKPEIVDFCRRLDEVIETLALSEGRSPREIMSELITNLPKAKIQGVVMQICAPNADRLSGEISLLGVVINRLRKIKTELYDREYILAIKAYQERLPIICSGNLTRENNGFVLKNPDNFSLDEIESMDL